MRAVVARVRRASVTIEDDDGAPLRTSGEIGTGLLVLLGVHRDDVAEPDRHVGTMARKLHELRLLRGGHGASGEHGADPATGAGGATGADGAAGADGVAGERSVAETGAPILLVSQFTLHGDTRKGRRPSWSAAARPADAGPLVDAVVAALRARGATVETGEFGARMAVESVNDGPFTVLIET